MILRINNWVLHIYKASMTANERHYKWRKKAIKEGKCVVCSSKKLSINPWTKKKYRKCDKCREIENKLCKVRRDKKY